MLPKEKLQENIITLLGIESLPEERKAVILEMMSDLIQRRVMLRVMDVLSDEDKDKMSEIEADADRAAAFIAEKVPNLEEIVKEEVLKSKQDLLQSFPTKE